MEPFLAPRGLVPEPACSPTVLYYPPSLHRYSNYTTFASPSWEGYSSWGCSFLCLSSLLRHTQCGGFTTDVSPSAEQCRKPVSLLVISFGREMCTLKIWLSTLKKKKVSMRRLIIYGLLRANYRRKWLSVINSTLFLKSHFDLVVSSLFVHSLL